MTPGEIPDAAVKAFLQERAHRSAGDGHVSAVEAYVASVWEKTRAGLAAALPHLPVPAERQREIEAETLRQYADRHHAGVEGVTTRTDYGTGIEYDAMCGGCGASVDEDDCCSERAQLLADTAAIETGGIE